MSDEVESVFEIDDAVSYEWTHFAVFRHPTYPGKFTTHWNSGCSCNSWEEPSVDELRADEPIERPEVRRQLISFLDTNKYTFSPGDTVRHLEEFEVAMSEQEAA